MRLTTFNIFKSCKCIVEMNECLLDINNKKGVNFTKKNKYKDGVN